MTILKKKARINDLSLKKLQKNKMKQIKSKVGSRKEIIKIRVAINQIEKSKILQKFNKTNIGTLRPMKTINF